MSQAASRRLRRLVLGGAGLVVGWLVVLLVAGLVGRGCARDHLTARIGASLRATASIDEVDLGLVRGRAAAHGLRIRKDEGGHLRISIRRAEVALAPLGLVAFDRRPRMVELDGVALEASTLAVLAAPDRKGQPIHVGGLVARDVHLTFLPTALLPWLGRVEVAIERVEAGPTVLYSALSWVFSLRSLRARITVAAGVTLVLEVDRGKLRVSGGLIGATPVEVPLVLPRLDPKREMTQLVGVIKDLVTQLAIDRAGGWLKQQVWDRVRDVVDPSPAPAPDARP
ncbi:MAG: hypothetical protein KBG28_28110 [Kofleriaceae bacterium]|jgi:hypothetical protein|nr:hypothetical protein [Kofleriaceae bacterium]